MSEIKPERQNPMKFLFKPLFFIFSLLTSTFIVLYVEKLRPSDLQPFEGLFSKEDIIVKSANYPVKSPTGNLTEEEMNYARIAWKYFENNYDASTGLMNGKDKCPMFTFKDLTSYLMGMLSAYEIGVIDSLEVASRMSKLMITLEKMELYEDKLPNNQYHTVSVQMLDGEGNVSPYGSGWSPIDIGRFFSFVNKIKIDYPQYGLRLRQVLKRWKMEEMVKNGMLEGMVYINQEESFRMSQVGRLGYEEYCGKGLFKAGFDVTQALLYTDFIKFVDIYGYKIGVDTRESRNLFSHNYVLSDPYYLDGLEYGWDINSRELAFRVFMVQKERYLKTGILTATGEDYTDDSAGSVYNSIYADFNTWVCYDEKGRKRNDLKMLSTKTAFAWYVLYEDDYVNLLFNEVKDLYNSKRG